MFLESLSDMLVCKVGSYKSLIIQGLSLTSSKAFVVSQLQKRVGVPFVLVTESNKGLEEWYSDLSFFVDESNLVSIPSFETDIYSGASPHLETQKVRACAFFRLTKEKPSFVLLSAKALVMRTVEPEKLSGLKLELGRDLAIKDLTETLLRHGYKFEEPVYGQGQFSVRGGIVDIWSNSEERPYRIEFFGDTIESIRIFDPETQLSVEKVDFVEVSPMREFIFGKEELKGLVRELRERFDNERFERDLRDIEVFVSEGEAFRGCEFLIPAVSPLDSDIFDYIPKEAIFVFDEPSTLIKQLNFYAESIENRFKENLAADRVILQPETFLLTADELVGKLNQFRQIQLRMLGKAVAIAEDELKSESPRKFDFIFSQNTHEADEVSLIFRPTRKYHGRMSELSEEIKSQDKKTRRVIVAHSEGMAQRITEVLRDYGVDVFVESNLNFDSGTVVKTGHLSSGFEFVEEKLIFQTEAELFDEIELPAPRQRKSRTNLDAFISDFRDLKPGDYVVHVDHGIGRFDGLETVCSEDAVREFMVLTYADKARLLVPVERLDLVSRYSSGEGREPQLDRLGGVNWQKTKARVRRAIREIADDLLRLYAERKLVKGFAFSPDTEWQKEFEEAFPYELTPDQASAIQAVKNDMEQETPMDRLIVGDVGYGKTEVAMRAAFKAVMDGKLVVVLAPTTVLAYQHFETFKSRFAAFPVNIELLSRFLSKAEQNQVLEKLEQGKVDILIGTHRVLSSDVDLPNLGLLIIDEEQRFGVVHKEKLKKLRKSVDVLTLSATPIPRTLNMALLGLRDISVIETPPRDRLAINTQVVPFKEEIIKSAIELEMARSGQVFFVHNRVETIDMMASKIQQIVPQARICITHGQMNEKLIEKRMLDFIDYKYDVLVATTIIENGIDIPRANTIIINRADKYGLAQLYQLRGRVGRSNRRAYAYLLIPPDIELSPIARKRLAAIREFSDLGAGFRLAALDLELRGAGNLLGAEQSGHIEALGFELYMKMLERTIRELRGEEIEDEIHVSIDLGVSTAIPADYISDVPQRLRVYKRITSANSEQELYRIRQEINDRYGTAPEAVENLILLRRLGILAESLRVYAIEKKGSEKLIMKFGQKPKVNPEKLIQLITSDSNLKFSPNGTLQITLNGESPFEKAYQILSKLRD
ncbi:MAG: transcription-repair coupling factor [Pyrinomonadaceae bacterium]|nr:transcription-repair coupling factor [Pyrinomonadaceae bacterium]MCX7639400.1 transcription-repair coupling factor [Pyrinomonadaceae bacterium]MDW8304550.1 transcription-repair coupling factor [Acidobacteriota bacterium]